MTVREAFEKAGHPVPEDAKIIQMFGTVGILFGAIEQFRERQCRGWAELKIRPTLEGFEWSWIPNGNRDVAKTIDLSNLPAIDAYDALPSVIQEVVRSNQ